MGNADIKPNKTPITDGFCPEIMTESELVEFLRIPEISSSENYHNVIEHLKKYRNLPRIRICRKPIYLKKAIIEWLEKETDIGK